MAEDSVTLWLGVGTGSCTDWVGMLYQEIEGRSSCSDTGFVGSCAR